MRMMSKFEVLTMKSIHELSLMNIPASRSKIALSISAHNDDYLRRNGISDKKLPAKISAALQVLREKGLVVCDRRNKWKWTTNVTGI